MNWLNNLISYVEFGEAGYCPKCGDENIEVLKHTHGDRGSFTFICRKCKATDHFDGISDMNCEA